MAVSQKPNEEYWALHSRIGKWNLWLLLVYPLLGLTTLFFGGGLLGYKFWPPYGGLLGALIGGGFGLIGFVTLCKKTIGFVSQSEESCQKCRRPYGIYNNGFRLDYLCGYCGNNNSVDLHDS